MPSVQTLIRWSLPGYDCDCGFHGWEDLEKQIKSEVRRQAEEGEVSSDSTDGIDGTIGEQGPDLQDFIRPEIDQLKINRIAEKQIVDAMSEGMLTTPETLDAGVSLLHKIWRDDCRILGEPVEVIEHRLRSFKMTEEEERVIGNIQRRLMLGEEEEE